MEGTLAWTGLVGTLAEIVKTNAIQSPLEPQGESIVCLPQLNNPQALLCIPILDVMGPQNFSRLNGGWPNVSDRDEFALFRRLLRQEISNSRALGGIEAGSAQLTWIVISILMSSITAFIKTGITKKSAEDQGDTTCQIVRGLILQLIAASCSGMNASSNAFMLFSGLTTRPDPRLDIKEFKLMDILVEAVQYTGWDHSTVKIQIVRALVRLLMKSCITPINQASIDHKKAAKKESASGQVAWMYKFNDEVMKHYSKVVQHYLALLNSEGTPVDAEAGAAVADAVAGAAEGDFSHLLTEEELTASLKVLLEWEMKRKVEQLRQFVTTERPSKGSMMLLKKLKQFLLDAEVTL